MQLPELHSYCLTMRVTCPWLRFGSGHPIAGKMIHELNRISTQRVDEMIDFKYETNKGFDGITDTGQLKQRQN
jgi:hypothetical protein